MIELRDITLAFGDRELMRGASATMRRGELVALLGRNGTGKSTLLRAIASLGRVQGGDVVIDGKPLAEITSQELARKVAFVNTERVDVEALTAFDLVAIGRAPYTDWMGRLGEEDRTIVERSLRLAGVENLMWRNVETLSDGECQRVMIARALAQQTDAILLDEPTSFLDLPNRYELCMLL
ncbi:MAG: ABC transporter ATP-binding protein, partial [Alistipes sp.]|nr:ABC transporter ATP-binding protein [Alistipes sp.]